MQQFNTTEFLHTSNKCGNLEGNNVFEKSRQHFWLLKKKKQNFTSTIISV